MPTRTWTNARIPGTSWPPEDARYKPVTVIPVEEMDDNGAAVPGYTRHWLIGGNLSIRRIRDDRRTGTTIDARELRSVETRLRHMDDMGVDVHVMYPTLFLTYLTSDPQAQTAICKSYNRWMADRASRRATGASGGWRSFRCWTYRCRRGGAPLGVASTGPAGSSSWRRSWTDAITDPYFFPVYQEANDLDLPLCMHTGSGGPAARRQQCSGLIGDGVTEHQRHRRVPRHRLLRPRAPGSPKLRFGFIEAGDRPGSRSWSTGSPPARSAWLGRSSRSTTRTT